MFAAPLSYLPETMASWPRPPTPPPERRCLDCGGITLAPDTPFCLTHFRHADSMEDKVAQKLVQLAKLESLPEAEQPKSAIVSLTNAICQLQSELESKKRMIWRPRRPQRPRQDIPMYLTLCLTLGQRRPQRPRQDILMCFTLRLTLGQMRPQRPRRALPAARVKP